MTNEWIIDVLADLRQYALRNRYMALAEQLDDAIVVAAGELYAEQEAASQAHADLSRAMLSPLPRILQPSA